MIVNGTLSGYLFYDYICSLSVSLTGIFWALWIVVLQNVLHIFVLLNIFFNSVDDV